MSSWRAETIPYLSISLQFPASEYLDCKGLLNKWTRNGRDSIRWKTLVYLSYSLMQLKHASMDTLTDINAHTADTHEPIHHTVWCQYKSTPCKVSRCYLTLSNWPFKSPVFKPNHLTSQQQQSQLLWLIFFCWPDF